MKAHNIYIIGAGGFAAECHMYLSERIKTDTHLIFKGFLAFENKLQQYGLADLYLGRCEDFTFSDDDSVIIAIGNPVIRKKIYYFLKAKKVSLYTLIALSASISLSSTIGDGNIFCHNVFIGPNVNIGNANLFNVGTTLGHDSSIGDFNMINGHVDITGGAQVGNSNIVGSHAVLVPNAKLGSHCKLSPGSVVYKKIKDYSLAVGNPAQTIFKLNQFGEIDGKVS